MRLVRSNFAATAADHVAAQWHLLIARETDKSAGGRRRSGALGQGRRSGSTLRENVGGFGEHEARRSEYRGPVAQFPCHHAVVLGRPGHDVSADAAPHRLEQRFTRGCQLAADHDKFGIEERHHGRDTAPHRLSCVLDSALPHAELVALGADVGKDLPFFLGDAPLARVSGMGESVDGLAATPRLHCLLVNPGVAVATAEAYAALRRDLWFMDLPGRHDRTAAMAQALSTGDIGAISAALYNDFEIVAERAHPVLKDLKQALLAFGARGALMSGSGPTLFGLFDADRPLANAEAALRAHYPAFVIARG